MAVHDDRGVLKRPGNACGTQPQPLQLGKRCELVIRSIHSLLEYACTVTRSTNGCYVCTRGSLRHVRRDKTGLQENAVS